jgi:uncharacterized protein YkwD
LFRHRAICATGVAALAALLALAVPAYANHRRRAIDAQACPGATTPAGAASRQALRTAVLCLVNQERASFGLPPMHASGELTRSAQEWSNAMVARGIFAHASNWYIRIRDTGYDWSTAGENIATGFPTALSVVSVWMGDDFHCRNILNPNFRDIGIGVNRRPVPGAANRPATWTQDFGLRMPLPPPSHNAGPQASCPH